MRNQYTITLECTQPNRYTPYGLDGHTPSHTLRTSNEIEHIALWQGVMTDKLQLEMRSIFEGITGIDTINNNDIHFNPTNNHITLHFSLQSNPTPTNLRQSINNAISLVSYLQVINIEAPPTTQMIDGIVSSQANQYAVHPICFSFLNDDTEIRNRASSGALQAIQFEFTTGTPAQFTGKVTITENRSNNSSATDINDNPYQFLARVISDSEDLRQRISQRTRGFRMIILRQANGQLVLDTSDIRRSSTTHLFSNPSPRSNTGSCTYPRQRR